MVICALLTSFLAPAGHPWGRGGGAGAGQAAPFVSATLPAHWDPACSQQGSEEKMGPEDICNDVKGTHSFPSLAQELFQSQPR